MSVSIAADEDFGEWHIMYANNLSTISIFSFE